ncbi:MAG: MerR family transcriptional regulator [Bacteroidales bacterium]|jgi:transposase-like protein|nr:MerR family transcriptional regulator [Bacteroidales bacterium]
MGYLTVKQASRKLGVTPHTIRAWIRELKEKEPITHSTHILTHSHKFNKKHITYTLTEELVNEWESKLRTPLRTHSTHSNTHFVTYPEAEERMGPPEQRDTRQDTSGQAVLSGVIETLQREIERQGDTLKQILQDHAKERERTDIIIMQLRADIMKLLPEGKQEQGKSPEKQEQEKPPEKPKQDTPEPPDKPEGQKPEEYNFTFGDRLWLFKEDVKRILNKKIF